MMVNETDGKISEYLDLVKQIKRQVSEPELVATLVTEVSKDRRVEQMRNERKGLIEVSHDNGDNGHAILATEKQRAFLKDLGIEVPRNLSKAKASELLEEAIAQRA